MSSCRFKFLRPLYRRGPQQPHAGLAFSSTFAASPAFACPPSSFPSATQASSQYLALVGAATMGVSIAALHLSDVCNGQQPGLPQAKAGFPISKSNHAHWTYQKELGTGAHGVVKLGQCQETGEIAAIKVVRSLDMKQRAVVQREIQALATIKDLGGHPHIIDLKYAYEDGKHNTCLVTEFVPGGELFDHVAAYGAHHEGASLHIFQEIVTAVAFLHQHRIIHGDLKPENILLTQPQYQAPDQCVKLADFGSSSELDRVHSDGKRIGGTSAYWSPEQFNPSFAHQTFAADLWSLGVILFILMTGCHPFDPLGTNSEEEIMDGILNHSVEGFAQKLESLDLSEDVTEVVLGLLHEDPAQRLTAGQLSDHPWIKQVVMV